MGMFRGILFGMIISFILWGFIFLAVARSEEAILEKVNSDEIRITESVQTVVNVKALKLELEKIRNEKINFEKQVPIARAQLETKIAKLEDILSRSETVMKDEAPQKEVR